ncbi:MAG: hypothetical protein QM784_39270 [Polyangiaceae bacterium]
MGTTKAEPPLTKAEPPLTKAEPPLTKAEPPLTKAEPPLTKAEPPLTIAEVAGVRETSCDLDPIPREAPGGAAITFRDFTLALAQLLDHLDTTNLHEAFQQFARSRNLDPDTPGLARDYMRLRILFEAVRDGGYWRLRWDITNREPSATLIWRAWQREPVDETFGHAWATAECDELSSLYSLLARRIGVDRVGLFYPTWNHTIAAWAIKSDSKQRQHLVLIPTTQIFLHCEDSFDTSGFKTQLSNIEPYPRWDIRDTSLLPADTASFLLQQVRIYAPASPDLQALLRARRAIQLKSSMGNCTEFRMQLGERLKGRLTCADRRALHHFASSELKREHSSDDELLEFLSSSAKELSD